MRDECSHVHRHGQYEEARRRCRRAVFVLGWRDQPGLPGGISVTRIALMIGLSPRWEANEMSSTPSATSTVNERSTAMYRPPAAATTSKLDRTPDPSRPTLNTRAPVFVSWSSAND